MSVFSKFRDALKKTRDGLSRKLYELFARGKIEDEFFDELEEILISSDISPKTAIEIADELRERSLDERIKDKDRIIELLKERIKLSVSVPPISIEFPAVIMVVGTNGTGKTTSIGKLSNYFAKTGKSVTIAAADTFRAAAADQLSVWADRAKVRIIRQNEGSDPSAVVFDAVASSRNRKTDLLIIDTAGRLQVKAQLMEELKKMTRVVGREYEEAHFYKLIVLDASLGQNNLSQVKMFDEAVGLDGIILTKLDGTSKGGFIISLLEEYPEIPVCFVGLGEKIDDIDAFDADAFIDGIL